MIIVLNGTSSSGKSSIVKAIQAQSEKVFLEYGLDKFIFMLPKKYLDVPLWNEVMGAADQAGEYGKLLIKGLHESSLSLDDLGMDLLMDHVLIEKAWKVECAALFADRNAFFVKIFCPLEVLEEREKSRKDRTLGQARKQFEIVHRDCVYDLEIDTSRETISGAAERIVDHVSRNVPSAFRAMKALWREA